MLKISNVQDPESYFDEDKFSSKVKKDLGRRNKTEKHLRPAPPPRTASIPSPRPASVPSPRPGSVPPSRPVGITSTPNNSEVVLTTPPAERTILSANSDPTPPRPNFAATSSAHPPEVPSFNSEVYRSTGQNDEAALRTSTRPTKGISKRRPFGGNQSCAVCHFCKKSFYGKTSKQKTHFNSGIARMWGFTLARIFLTLF